MPPGPYIPPAREFSSGSGSQQVSIGRRRQQEATVSRVSEKVSARCSATPINLSNFIPISIEYPNKTAIFFVSGSLQRNTSFFTFSLPPPRKNYRNSSAKSRNFTISLPLSFLRVVKFCRFPQLPQSTAKKVIFSPCFTGFYRFLPLPQNIIIYPVAASPEWSKQANTLSKVVLVPINGGFCHILS